MDVLNVRLRQFQATVLPLPWPTSFYKRRHHHQKYTSPGSKCAAYEQTAALVGKAAAAAEFRSTAETLSATTGATTRQVTNVASAVKDASLNVQTVASAAEELRSSIAEIARQVAQSSTIAGKAVDDARHT